jgi:hypothetical protein
MPDISFNRSSGDSPPSTYAHATNDELSRAGTTSIKRPGAKPLGSCTLSVSASGSAFVGATLDSLAPMQLEGGYA